MAKPKPMLSVEVVRELLDYDPQTGAFTWKERDVKFFSDDVARRKWNTRFKGKPALCTLSHNGYMYGAIFGENWSTHRIAWLHHHGEVPREVDHINGDRTDNRIANLREVSREENCRNSAKGSKNTSGHIGISWSKGMKAWDVRIRKERLGHFKNFDEAVAARKAAEARLGFHPNHGRVAALKEA